MSITDSLKDYYILLTDDQILISNIINKIDSNLIDINKSRVYKNNNFLIIEIFDIDKKRCPFAIDFGTQENKNEINFYFHHSAPIMEAKVNNSNDVNNIQNLIIEYLSSKVYEEISYVKNEIYKVKYKFFQIIGNKSYLVPFVSYKRILLFWRKKSVECNEYIPWLTN